MAGRQGAEVLYNNLKKQKYPMWCLELLFLVLTVCLEVNNFILVKL